MSRVKSETQRTWTSAATGMNEKTKNPPPPRSEDGCPEAGRYPECSGSSEVQEDFIVKANVLISML